MRNAFQLILMKSRTNYNPHGPIIISLLIFTNSKPNKKISKQPIRPWTIDINRRVQESDGTHSNSSNAKLTRTRKYSDYKCLSIELNKTTKCKRKANFSSVVSWIREKRSQIYSISHMKNNSPNLAHNHFWHTWAFMISVSVDFTIFIYFVFLQLNILCLFLIAINQQ